MVLGGRFGKRDVQLVVSLEMLETLETVLIRQGFAAQTAQAYIDGVRDIVRYGPDELDPYLLLGDGREQFATRDTEDAGILATGFASGTSLLVTDNLKDFETNDALRADTRVIASTSGVRQLCAFRHQRSHGDMIVACPLDVVDWLRQGIGLEPDTIWNHLSQTSARGHR